MQTVHVSPLTVLPTRPRRLTAANAATFARAVLATVLLVLVIVSWHSSVSRSLIVALATVALLTDLVDGWIARTFDQVTPFGAAFDMEVDAFLILVLSLYVVPLVGPVVLLIGLARYLLAIAGVVWPWLTAPTPPRRWAKVVAAVQGIVLTVVGADVLARDVAYAAVLASLALLVESFAHQVVVLRQLRHARQVARSPLVRPIFDVVAVALVWAALMAPHRPDDVSVASLLGIPLELLLFVALAVVLPPVWGRIVGAVGGVALMGTLVLSGLDLGFYEAFDRPFNPLSDPGYAGSGLDLVHRSAGRSGQILAVGAVALLVLGGLALCVWAALRLRRAAHGTPRVWARVVVALALVWVVAGIGGAHLSGVPVASAPAASLVRAQIDEVRAELHDRAVFERTLAHDPYSGTHGRDLLRDLRGKDVVLVFVESYGRVAVDGSWFAPMVDRTLSSSSAELGSMGYSIRSGWLRSPTFGGISWLAHSTLQTGLWIDSQQRYDRVISGERFNLSQAFARAGWRTVSDVPSDEADWEDGRRFYGFDHMYDARNVGYAGPRFSYARIPDQYTLKEFAQRELRPGDRDPVMAEIDLVSSHTPWTPIPRLLPWRDIGDGSAYNGMRPSHSSFLDLLGGADQQRNYARSIQYSLRSLVSFVRHAHDKNLVMIVLGDHQPNTNVTGTGVSHDVPISLIAHEPDVIRQIQPWHWTPGLQPDSDLPVLGMDAFRDRFLSAFGSHPASR